MIKNLIFSLIIMVAATGYAVELSERNDGDVLIFPVVYTDGQFASLLNLQNISEQPIVAKVVVHDGVNGQIQNAFSLFLAADDSWSAAFFDIFQDDEVGLITSDSSCVDQEFGTIATTGQTFVAVGAQGQAWVEVFALGALSDTDAERLIQDPTSSTNTCVSPENIGEVELLSVANPLSGSAQVINVLQGVSFSIPVTALKDFGLAGQNKLLGPEIPTLASATPARAVIDGLTFLVSSGLDAVNAVLAVSAIRTPVQVESVLAGRTDLLLTFPTRHLSSEAGTQPFVVNTDPAHSESGQQLRGFFYNGQGTRFGITAEEERLPVTPTITCTPPPPPLTVFGPVVSQSQLGLFFQSDSNAPGSLLALDDTEPATVVTPNIGCGLGLDSSIESETGFYEVAFSGFETVALNGRRFSGLPVIPISITTVSNGTLVDSLTGQNVLSNYGWVNQLVIERE